MNDQRGPGGRRLSLDGERRETLSWATVSETYVGVVASAPGDVNKPDRLGQPECTGIQVLTQSAKLTTGPMPIPVDLVLGQWICLANFKKSICRGG